MSRVFASDYRDKNAGRPGPFPVHKLKRVDRPTTVINDDEVSRMDERDGGFHRAGQGDYGDFIKKEFDVHAEIYTKVRELLKPGNVYGEIDDKVKEIARKKGYHPQNAFSLQHIGLGIIDVIPKDTVLEPGMVFVNHPWIEYPAENPEMGGHIIGDTYIITDEEPKCISKMPLELVII